MQISVNSQVRVLTAASILYLLSAGLGTALSIAQHWPARFGGILNGNDVATDFLTLNGTALSPPLFMLVAQVAFMIAAPRPTQAGTVGIAGLTALGVLYVIGELGEPILVRAFDPSAFDPAVAAIVVGNILFAALMVVFGMGSWRTRATTRPASK